MVGQCNLECALVNISGLHRGELVKKSLSSPYCSLLKELEGNSIDKIMIIVKGFTSSNVLRSFWSNWSRTFSSTLR